MSSDIKKTAKKLELKTGTGKRAPDLALAGIGISAGKKKQDGEAKSQGGSISSPPEQRRELGIQAKAPDPVLPEHKDSVARQESNKQAAKAEWQKNQSAGISAANAALDQRSAGIHADAAARINGNKSWASAMKQQIQQTRASLQAPTQKQELSK